MAFLTARCGRAVSLTATAALLIGTWSTLAAADEPSPAERAAGERVVAALNFETEGRNDLRRQMLEEAMLLAPDHEPARWQAGYVREGERWLTVAEAQAERAADPLRAEYLQLRATAGDTAQAHWRLADWCRRNRFKEAEEAHLLKVLEYNPNHKEALKRLGAEWYQGQLLTHDEIREAKAQIRATNKALSKWKAVLAPHRSALESKDDARRTEALDALHAVLDETAIGAIEDVLSNSREERAVLAAVELIGEIPGQAAVDSLVRHALRSSSAGVREAAIARLQSRSLYSFVPDLLDAMQMPIEADIQIVGLPGAYAGVHVDIYGQDRQARYHFDSSQLEVYTPRVERNLQEQNYVRLARLMPRYYESMRRARNNAIAQARSAKQAVARQSRTIAERNERIRAILESTTGEYFGANPGRWWTWWTEFNEQVRDSYEQPIVYEYETPPNVRYVPAYTIRLPPTRPTGVGGNLGTTCFTAGTPVWTETGLRPVESIQYGDRVLAQDPTTGKLAFKLVIQTTASVGGELSPVLELDLGDESIGATVGHVFWVCGEGWRMAKELSQGTLLHAQNGSIRLSDVRELEPEPAYNLVVEDFHTYFVGRSGLLVHDIEVREASDFAVPGLPRTELATTAAIAPK